MSNTPYESNGVHEASSRGRNILLGLTASALLVASLVYMAVGPKPDIHPDFGSPEVPPLHQPGNGHVAPQHMITDEVVTFAVAPTIAE